MSERSACTHCTAGPKVCTELMLIRTPARNVQNRTMLETVRKFESGRCWQVEPAHRVQRRQAQNHHLSPARPAEREPVTGHIRQVTSSLTGPPAGAARHSMRGARTSWPFRHLFGMTDKSTTGFSCSRCSCSSRHEAPPASIHGMPLLMPARRQCKSGWCPIAIGDGIASSYSSLSGTILAPATDEWVVFYTAHVKSQNL